MPFDPLQRAALHPIVRDRPAVDFFDGALLGNGGMGVVVCTRPDAIVLFFGHNSVWDIRVAEAHADKIGTFAELFKRIESIWENGGSLATDKWFQDYCAMANENYSKPYPRPYPCGALLLGFDRRKVELLGHRLDLATGVCDVSMRLADGRTVKASIFVDLDTDRLWLQTVDDSGRPCAPPFERIKIMPDESRGRVAGDPSGWGSTGSAAGQALLPATEAIEPADRRSLAFRQVLPFQESCEPHAKDRAFRFSCRTTHDLGRRTYDGWSGKPVEMATLERAIEPAGEMPFALCVQLEAGLAADLPPAMPALPDPAIELTARAAANLTQWSEYWRRSGIAIDNDAELECIWYRNLYFLRCVLSEKAWCPGLFGNWSYRGIGTAWHSDYHMNYNTQQLFWASFNTNHVEHHLPYVNLVDHLLPVSRKWAKEYYGLSGAYFPHSAYPTEMNIMPYWVPSWAWEICETPWTVQSLWWHYLYTMDEGFLRQRAITPMREAVEFLVAYMTRPEAHGPRWKDDRYHIFPTVPPELYGLTDRWEKNCDCLVDLTLTKFVFHAYLKAVNVLKLAGADAELAGRVKEVLARFPEYEVRESARGKVFVSAPGESTEIVYNCPNNTMTVFPGEEHGLDSPREQYEIAANSYRQQQNEGGNDLVHLNLQAARLGLLDLERFKRQVRYCTTGNGAATDMVLQSRGRYPDEMPFDFMLRMGIWTENFALPAVIAECMMQSYPLSTSPHVCGPIRLFPNWPADKPAEFCTLRATGAFLVSARIEEGVVVWVEITSEKGKDLRLINPWPGPAQCINETGVTVLDARLIELPTKPGQTLRFQPA